jgi:hypothetical protein
MKEKGNNNPLTSIGIIRTTMGDVIGPYMLGSSIA